MKVKEIDATANMAWSPGPAVPIMIAAGTSAQQLDASFNTSSSLDIYELDLTDSNNEMGKLCSFGVDNRYHKLVWGDAGMANGDREKGVIVGGLDRGFISIYDAGKLIKGQENPIIFSKDKHTGPVTALDFNPFQSNLLASGASESEIFIWDLNRLQTPMSPGAKSQPIDDVRCIAWNRQVQHILASTFSTRCVVWDLRKNEPIIKVSDSTSRVRCKAVEWNPEVATQLCIASEDDQTPVIQIWDLRLASSPLRTLEYHQRGILSLAWCKQDSDLLLSCGKDNRILCWNPNSNQPGGEVLCELGTSNQWSFEISWCPRNPAVLATSSFDGKVSVYSLMGGSQVQAQPSKAIADSFPGMENMQPLVQPTQQASQKSSAQLTKPPKWLRRPCGGSFGFGGKLVTFVSNSNSQAQSGGSSENTGLPASSVYVSGVVTEPDLIQRSMRLECTLESRNLPEFCQTKKEETMDRDREVWSFIEAALDSDPRMKYLNLLGYEPNEVAENINKSLRKTKPANANRRGSLGGGDELLSEELSKMSTSNGVLDDFEFIAAKVEEEAEISKPFSICVDDSGPGLLSRALLTGNLNLAVEFCLEQGRLADALILAMQDGPELLQEAQKKYFIKCSDSSESHLIRAVVCQDWRSIIERCDVENWREALAAAITHAANEELPSLCAFLGQRLLAKDKDRYGQEALLCFICASNLDKVVECWIETRDTTSGPKSLQDLIEVVMSLKFAIETSQGFQVEIGTGPLSEKLGQYASLLASQGALKAASVYLSGQVRSDETLVALKDRLIGALNTQTVKPTQAPQRNRLNSQSKNQFSRDTLATRPSWGQTAYGGPQQGYHNQVNTLDYNSAPQVPSYQYGYQGHVQEDTSFMQQPLDSGLSGPRRNSRPGYQAADNFGQRNPSGDVQPPVNIFTPNFSQPASPPQDQAHQGGMLWNAEPAYIPPTSSGPGWNDPPPLSSMSRTKTHVKTVNTMTPAFEPITQPLYGAPSVPAIPDPSMMGVQNQGYGHFQPTPVFTNTPPQPQYGQGSYTPAPQFSSHQSVGSAATYTPMQPSNPPSQMAVTKPQTPEPPKPKGPIPEQHKVVHEVFESLKSKCLSAAVHPQTRRKLDDVSKKLEVLYDKLRENSLPPATTTGLHDIVRHIWAYDYNSCLTVIQQMISSGSFDILAEFMPGVKVLIQVAMQLGTYLEGPR